MFERFTNRARQAIIEAQEAAKELKHGYIGSEHLMAGLAREHDGLGAKVLEDFELTTERIQDKTLDLVGAGDTVSEGNLQFTPRTKRVLELALREALSLGHNYVGTEHILLGLIREGEGIAQRIFDECGIDTEDMRRHVIEQLSMTREQRREAGRRA